MVSALTTCSAIITDIACCMQQSAPLYTIFFILAIYKDSERNKLDLKTASSHGNNSEYGAKELNFILSGSLRPEDTNQTLLSSFVGLNYKKDIGPEVVEASGNYEPPADCSILGREVEFSCYIVGTGTVIQIKTKYQSQSINNNNFIKSLA